MSVILHNAQVMVEGKSSQYRLVSLMRLPVASGAKVFNEAVLYHEHQSLRVAWHSETVDSRLTHGSLVSVVWGMNTSANDDGGCLRIGGLELLDKPNPGLNIFLTVPTPWVTDRTSIQRAAALWEQLSCPFQHLLNSVLWDGGRFYRYVTGPVSTADDLRAIGGNFRQTVATAERAALLTSGQHDVSTSIVITAAFLLNAGKADDFHRSADGYALSERGYWIGGQYTILEWLAVARSEVIVPEEQYIALVHTLIAARGRAEHAQSIEAAILGVANRLKEIQKIQDLVEGERCTSK
ncbi:hypothetical protein [Azonexus sp.]|uniref:hypothetical protein n=1 Tax=Azonexus sp. TaxID=1872668 RepID=UPI0035AF3AFD